MKDKMLETLRQMTKISFALVAVLTGASAYLISRSIGVVVGDIDPFTTQQTQASYQGLKVSFSAMTILWPLALGTTSIALCVSTFRRGAIFQAYRSSLPLDESAVADYVDLGGTWNAGVELGVVSNIRSAVAAIATLPRVALGLSLVAPLLHSISYHMFQPGAPEFRLSEGFSWAFVNYMLALIASVTAWRMTKPLSEAVHGLFETQLQNAQQLESQRAQQADGGDRTQSPQ